MNKWRKVDPEENVKDISKPQVLPRSSSNTIMPTVSFFLSHAFYDAKYALEIQSTVQSFFRGLVQVFCSSDAGASIKPGEDIKTIIKSALEESEATILLLSRESLNRPWLNIEFGASWILEKPIIPLCLPGLDHQHLPSQLQGIKVCRLDDVKSCKELISSLLNHFKETFSSFEMTDAELEENAQILHKNIKTISKGIVKVQIPDEMPPERKTVWVFGSNSSVSEHQKTIIDKIINIVPAGLARMGIRLVVGQSNMLEQIADNYRDEILGSPDHLPNPIVLPGKLRQRNLKYLFNDTIGRVPDLAILLGGGIERGRVQEEYDCAIEAGIPVLAVPSTGGVASVVESTAKRGDKYQGILYAREAVDAGDLAFAILKTIEAYTE